MPERGEREDAAAADAGADANTCEAATHDAAGCNDLVNDAAAISATCAASGMTPPSPMGGTVAEGVYELASQVFYRLP